MAAVASSVTKQNCSSPNQNSILPPSAISIALRDNRSNDRRRRHYALSASNNQIGRTKNVNDGNLDRVRELSFTPLQATPARRRPKEESLASHNTQSFASGGRCW